MRCGLTGAGKREDVWIWTAVVEEMDGNRWEDFEVGGRDERLPESGLYRSDAYPVYQWLPRDRHVVGKGGAVNRNGGCFLCGGAS